MENLTENQVKSKMRKIAKENGLKLKFESLSFGDNPTAKAFLAKLAKLRSNTDFKILAKSIKCYGLKDFVC